MNVTLNQAAKMATIAALILGGLTAGAGAFVYSTDQAKTQGRLEQSVEELNKRLTRIESKIDALAIGPAPGIPVSAPQAIGFTAPQDRKTLVRASR